MYSYKEPSKNNGQTDADAPSVQRKEDQQTQSVITDNRSGVAQLQKDAVTAIGTKQLQKNGVIQRQQTDVCLKSASGTYQLEDEEHTFDFREDSKGSDVLITTKSHPSGKVDYTAMIIKYLKKYGIIPRAATNVVVTAQNTYGIRK